MGLVIQSVRPNHFSKEFLEYIFMELDFTISSEILGFSLEFFVCFEKVSCMALYSEKIGVWNVSQMMWDLFQTSTLMQRTCLS